MKLDKIEYPEAGLCLLTLSADAAELEAGAQAVYERTRGNYTIPGFEKGQADRAQIEAVRGEHVFWYDAINDIMDQDTPALLEKAIADEGLSVEGEPAYDLVSVKKDEGFVATAALALTPVLTLKQYTGFTATCSPVWATDQEVDTMIEQRRMSAAELVPHKGPAVKGNTVHLTFEGECNGEAFEGGKGEHVAIELGRGRMIPGFEEGVLGHQAGESFDINVVFPGNYPVRTLAGRPAVFHCTLDDVCLKQIPALNADLAKKLDPNCSTVEELRAAVRLTLNRNRHSTAMMNARNEILAQVAAGAEGPVCSLLIDRRYAAEMQQLQSFLQMRRLSLDAYLNQKQQTREELAAQLRAEAERRVRIHYAIAKVVELEGLQFTEEEMEAELRARAERLKKDPAQFAATANRDVIRAGQEYTRGSEFIFNHCTIVDVPIPGEPEKPAQE